MSEFGGAAENICSHGVFRILTQLRHPQAADADKQCIAKSAAFYPGPACRGSHLKYHPSSISCGADGELNVGSCSLRRGWSYPPGALPRESPSANSGGTSPPNFLKPRPARLSDPTAPPHPPLC